MLQWCDRDGNGGKLIGGKLVPSERLRRETGLDHAECGALRHARYTVMTLRDAEFTKQD
jgi:hypothetical protein